MQTATWSGVWRTTSTFLAANFVVKKRAVYGSRLCQSRWVVVVRLGTDFACVPTNGEWGWGIKNDVDFVAASFVRKAQVRDWRRKNWPCVGAGIPNLKRSAVFGLRTETCGVNCAE
eukprot:TRINITY_DN5889_c0_g1_i1.p1 TRINITY_DN5889_c0_g1~~TRINITY_DN5889_c0_g1_i1.p1  ORF type:complete len:116 (-),score=8.99 TRINITY_DN5889_c0_g1_i1:1026-1373(-)